jgi:hypothetical protein
MGDRWGFVPDSNNRRAGSQLAISYCGVLLPVMTVIRAVSYSFGGVQPHESESRGYFQVLRYGTRKQPELMSIKELFVEFKNLMLTSKTT